MYVGNYEKLEDIPNESFFYESIDNIKEREHEMYMKISDRGVNHAYQIICTKVNNESFWPIRVLADLKQGDTVEFLKNFITSK